MPVLQRRLTILSIPPDLTIYGPIFREFLRRSGTSKTSDLCLIHLSELTITPAPTATNSWECWFSLTKLPSNHYSPPDPATARCCCLGGMVFTLSNELLNLMLRSSQILLAVLMLGGGGCATRGNVELLESQLRQQEDQLFAIRTQLETAETELRVAQKEVGALRVQLAKNGAPGLLPEQAQSLYRVTGIRVNKFFTGGLDRDNQPGDDLLNVVLTPHDEQGESVKLPGRLELEVLDLSAAEPARRLGVWHFPAEELAKLWHSGLTTGFQLRLPWQRQPSSEDLMVQARFVTADGREFGTSAEFRVALAPDVKQQRIASAQATVRQSSPQTHSATELPNAPPVPFPEAIQSEPVPELHSVPEPTTKIENLPLSQPDNSLIEPTSSNPFDEDQKFVPVELPNPVPPSKVREPSINPFSSSDVLTSPAEPSTKKLSFEADTTPMRYQRSQGLPSWQPLKVDPNSKDAGF